jgi:hypothetical protein
LPLHLWLKHELRLKREVPDGGLALNTLKIYA